MVYAKSLSEVSRMQFKSWLAAGLIAACLALPAASAPAAENPAEDNAYQHAVQLFNQHDWDGARKAFAEFQAAYPRSVWRWAAQLRQADLESSPAAAEKLYAEVLTAAAGSEWGQDARWGLANTQFAQGKFREAAVLFDACGQSRDPRRAHAWYLAGRCQLALSDPKAAAAFFSRVQTQFPDSLWAAASVAGLGDAAAARKDNAAALAAYDQYLKAYPDGDLALTVAEQRAKLADLPGSAAGSPEAKDAMPTPASAAAHRAPEAAEGFTVQVGAFSKPEYAALLVAKLRKQGYNAYLLTSRTGSEVFHQVRVGNYASRQLAEQIGSKLEKKEHLPTLIAPYVKPEEPAAK
jgi:cell division septation protein DedD